MVTPKDRIIYYQDKIITKRLNQFTEKYGFMSRSRAIAWLITWALSKDPTPPPQRDEFEDEY